jgi:predicted small lipoprotein YifL
VSNGGLLSKGAVRRSGGSLARRRILALLGLGAAAALGACGKKGDLRLPEPAPSSPQPSDEEEK